MTPVAHGGTIGLAGEVGLAVAITLLLLWALWKSRQRQDRDDERSS
jgi:hypothetical protein